MNEKVTKRWVDSLNSTLFTLNVKKNLDLCFLGEKIKKPITKTQKDPSTICRTHGAGENTK
jgi:hypothetical protein